MKNRALLFLAAITVISSAFIKPNTNEPKPITVVIDAGHGGSDLGASHSGAFEKVIVSQIAEKVKSLNKDKNITILLTRSSDEFITLNKRTDYINTIKPDLVLSLHLNSNLNEEKSGVEFFVSDNAAFSEKSNKLANQLNATFAKNNALKVTDTKIAKFHILKKSEAPAIVVELGYLSNENDKKYLTDNGQQNEIAKNILTFLSEIN